MAASSADANKKSNVQNNKSDQLIESSIESKNVLPTSSVAKEEVTKKKAPVGLCLATEQGYNLSPNLIEKHACVPLAAPCIRTRIATRGVVAESAEIAPARPFEEILVPDASFESSTKTKNGGNS